MSKSISRARAYRIEEKKLRKKAKEMILKQYPELMSDLYVRKKTFEAIDAANVAVDSNGKLRIVYENNNDLKNFKINGQSK